MTEKAKGILLCAIMVGLQGLVARAFYIAMWSMESNWTFLLADEPLPLGATIAFKFGYAIPSVAAIASAIILFGVLRWNIRAGNWLTIVAMAEIIAIVSFVVGITEPGLFILWSLGR